MKKMELNQKQQSMLKDLRSQERICVEKYAKYASAAQDRQLQELFRHIGESESRHLQTLDRMAAGQAGGGQGQQSQGQQGQPWRPSAPSTTQPNSQQWQNDSYLCSDALATEKHVSSEYNTGVFEFADQAARQTLNHIQKEEQEHGELIYNYMSGHGMYS